MSNLTINGKPVENPDATSALEAVQNDPRYSKLHNGDSDFTTSELGFILDENLISQSLSTNQAMALGDAYASARRASGSNLWADRTRSGRWLSKVNIEARYIPTRTSLELLVPGREDRGLVTLSDQEKGED